MYGMCGSLPKWSIDRKFHKLTLKDKHHYFRKYVPECTYCESCEDICEQKAIWIIDPEWEEL